MNKLLKK